MSTTVTFHFPPRTQTQFKQRTIMVAWVTQQENGFRGSNVTASIQRKLAQVGFSVSQSLVKRSMDWLSENNYAAMVVVGRRTVGFAIHHNVKVPKPAFLSFKEAMAVDSDVDRAPVAAQLPLAAPNVPKAPPLPKAVSSFIQSLTQLGAKVQDWHKEDPAAAEAWVEAALEAL